MSNIEPSKSIKIEDELNNLALYRYHPNGIFNAAISRLQDMVDGRIEIVDPSNPFVYLLETSSLNTAYAVQEYTELSRKRYPRLANNEDDLYLHMSDSDFLGRFSEPAYAYVEYNILFNDFRTKGYYDPILKENVLKIPRNYKVSVDKYIFTLPSGIIIRHTENGVIDVKYENQTYNNIFPVNTNFIDFSVKSYNQEETYINFKIRTPEVDLETVDIPVEKSKLFRNTINYNPNREFYYFQAYHLQDGEWKEMIVTHTEQVYDINTPTCAIRLDQVNKEIEYYIPPVYVNTNRLGTKVKFVIYTTCGPINVNFSDHKAENFSSEYNPIFPELELDQTTDPIRIISKVIHIKDEVVGGKGPLTFDELKENVINNSIGDRKLPITSKQLDYSAKQRNFRIIRDVDIITKRVLLLECDVPGSPSRYPITKMNMDLMEFVSTVSSMSTGKNNVFGINSDITIIPENTLFKIDGNGLVIVDYDEWRQVTSMSDIALVDKLNSTRYLSTFYHYVLDTSGDRTRLRAYDLSGPKVEETNFMSFNATTRIGINTTSTNLQKTQNGYTLDILANLKRYSESLNETNITPYLVYVDENGGRFYLEGRLYTTLNDSPVYRFDIISDYYVNADNEIIINNFMDNNGSFARVNIPLTSKLELLYISNVIPGSFVASEMDRLIYGSFLSIGRAVVSQEKLTTRFGYWLEHLDTQVHSSVGNYQNVRYTEDVILRSDCIVYDHSNSIVLQVGDPIIDPETEQPIIQHYAGDLVLGEDGLPIPIRQEDMLRYMKLMFIDYRATVVTNPLVKNYVRYLRSYMTEMITENAKVIQDDLLENTSAYLVVPKSLDNVKVRSRGRETYIRSGQDFLIAVYVTARIYDDAIARQGIETSILNIIENYLYTNRELSKTVLLNHLYSNLKEFIKGISVDKFTELNEEFIEIVDANSRIGLNKVITLEPDGYDIKEDVTINFIRVE